MDELSNPKKRKRKRDATLLRAHNRKCKNKCASTNRINSKRTRKGRKRLCDCRRAPFNLNTNKTTITIKRDFVVRDALRLNPAQGPFDKNMFVDKHKNDVDQIFECIKIKSETINNNLKMKIKKCQKKTKRKEAQSDMGDAKDDGNKVSNDKNCVQQVVNKILTRKRQTCRKQFRHKDITLYKLGSDNNKGPSPKKEVIQKIFQRRTSHCSLPPKQHAEKDCCTPEVPIPVLNVNETVKVLENRCNSTDVGSLELKQESLLRINKNGTQLHQEDNVSTKKQESTHMKRGSLNYSIASLTSESYGKHNLPIRIPEKRSSIAEPLYTLPPYLRFQIDQSLPAASFNFLTSNLVNDPGPLRPPTKPPPPISKDGIGCSTIIDKVSNTEKLLQNRFDVTKAKNLDFEKNSSTDFFKKYEPAPVITKISDSSNSNYVTSATITNLAIPHSHAGTTTQSLSLHASPKIQLPNNNALHATKHSKRRSLYPEAEKPNTSLATSSVPNANTAYNYPQHTSNSQSFLPYNQAYSILPAYIPFKPQPHILSPLVYSYNYDNSLHFSNTVNCGLQSNPQVQSQTYLPNDSLTSFSYQTGCHLEKPASPKVATNARQTESVLKDEVPVNSEKDSLVSTKPKQECVGQSSAPKNKVELHNAAEDTSKQNDETVVSISTGKDACPSPLVISDSEPEVAETKDIALNLSTAKSQLSDTKSGLILTPFEDGKLSNSAQTRVMQTLTTLTYVVNEIIDKAGDNMPKQEKELLHKLLENVSETSIMGKKCEVAVKQEDFVQLISSDSELSNDATPVVLTDSNGTLDLSIKKCPNVNDEASRNSNSANESTVDPSRVLNKSSEGSVLNLIKKSRFEDDGSSIINLSMRDRKDKFESFAPKENGEMHTSRNQISAINTLPPKSSKKSEKEGYQVQDLVAQKQPSSSSANANNSKPYIWSSYCIPASCSMINEPVEVKRGRSSTDTVYGNNWFRDSTTFDQKKSTAKQHNVKKQYDNSQNALWSKKNRVDYSNPHLLKETHPKTNQKRNDFNSIHVTYPSASFTNYSAFGTSESTANRSDCDKNATEVWQQYKTNVLSKQKVDKSIKELLRKKHKNSLKTTHSSYVNCEKPSPAFTQSLGSVALPETSGLPKANISKHQRNCHYTNHNTNLVEGAINPHTNNQSFVAYRDKFNNAWDNTQKRDGDYHMRLLPDFSFSKSTESNNPEAHTLNHNVSPDYGYFSPLSKFAPVTENTQHANVSHTHTAFTKSLDSLNHLDALSKNAKNQSGTHEKPHSSSPILHQRDQEKVLKILPKLHSTNTLTPEQYVMEVHVLETDGCPRPFLDFYSYITKKQIASNQRPVCFRIFLEFQNAGKLKEFERAFKIYSQKHENEKHILKDT